LNDAISVLGEMAQDRRWPRFVQSIELFTNETETQVNVLESRQHVSRRFFEWCAERIPGALAPALDYAASGHVYRVGPRSFFQVNRFLTERLVETAVGGLGGEQVLDLYAGVGLFSLPLAAQFGEVIAIESGRGAIEDLRFNAERAGRKLVAVQADSEKFLSEFSGAPDLVVADPPRAGMGKRVLAELARLQPRTLVIVACDPSTLARDLAVLLNSGFRIDKMTMVDLFPQTFHLEAVVRLIYQPRMDTDAHG
jgi:23S rRNA (uracil1939-C5)-methyltransferase